MSAARTLVAYLVRVIRDVVLTCERPENHPVSPVPVRCRRKKILGAMNPESLPNLRDLST
jgi:hypothetical protein